MVLQEKSSFQENKELKFLFEFNIYFLLIVINFLTYSVYAVASKYNIFIVEILIYLNFVIFYFFYKKNPKEKITIQILLSKREIIFFTGLLFFLIFLTYSELIVPLFGDEIAPTRRATRTAYFSSLIFLEILNLDYLKSLPIKYIIQIFNIIQIMFIIGILYLFKKKPNILNLIILLLTTFALRLFIKDGVHHPPLNHLFSTTFVSIFGLNHFTIRIAYLVPFWIFLVMMYKLIRDFLDEKPSIFFILSIATFPIFLVASTTPDHSLWSAVIFTYLLFYINLKKNIDYKFCILIISIAILFRVTIFTGFILIGACFFIDAYNKKFFLFKKILYLLKNEKIYAIFFIFIPLLFVSSGGTPAFEGLDKVNPLNYFVEAIKSKIIIYSLIKQIPEWYYIFLIFIFLSKRKIEILIFFIFNLIIYFSIEPDLWGLAKYVLEYAVPFFLLGSFIFFKFFLDKKKIFLAYLVSFGIILFNIYDFYNFPNSNISADKINKIGITQISKNIDKKTKYILKLPYAYDEAFQYVSNKNAKSNTLLIGSTYGFFPQVIERYNYFELKKIINLSKKFDDLQKTNYSLSGKIQKISEAENLLEKIKIYLNFMKKTEVVQANKNTVDNDLDQNEKVAKFSNIKELKNLEYIIVAGYGEKIDLINYLLSNNWKLEKKYIQKNYRSTIKIFKKD